MTKDLKKVEAGKRLAEYNQRKREELAKAQKIESKPKLTSSPYYGTGAIVAVVALGVLGCYIYQSKKGDATKVTPVHQSKEGDVTPVQSLEPKTINKTNDRKQINKNK